MAKTSTRREFLQLAHTLDLKKHKVAGWYASTKLDGSRCLWDGGVSRGMPTIHVPYASIADPKTGDLKNKIKPKATGLWSRYGNPIMAPDWFLDQLPKGILLDGELWAGNGTFQLCRSIVAGDVADARFDQVQFCVYGSPRPEKLFGAGEIKNANFLRTFDDTQLKFWSAHVRGYGGPPNFAEEYDMLRTVLDNNKVAYRLHQTLLHPTSEETAREQLNDYLEEVVGDGGEGVMLRDPKSMWTPKRVNHLLKFKPFNDDEAEVTGWVAGKAGKTGQVKGKIGALIVRWQGKEFELGSGLTMEERDLTGEMALWAAGNPGKRFPDDRWSSTHFQYGQVVTFKYRELSDDGIPKEGRYFRKRGDE